MRFKGLRFSDVRRTLVRNGFSEEGQNGSHVKFTRGGRHVVVTDNGHGVNRMVWKRIKKENGITECR